MVGINSVIFSPSGGSVGVGFDIPAATAKIDHRYAHQAGSHHPRLAWRRDPGRDARYRRCSRTEGAQRRARCQILQGGPAASSGLKAGDLITAVNGKTIKNGRELVQSIGDLAPGTSVQLDIVRKAQTKQVALTLGTMPAQQQTPPA